MKLFDAAKTVSIIEIYKKYTNNPVKGKEGKNGVTVKCPFHDDRKPSLGLFTKDNGFFCYNPNCHEKGDSIDFVRKLFNLSNYEAAIKICKDFGVEYEGPRVRSVAEPKEDAEDPEAILLNNKRLTIYFVKCLEKAPNPKFFEERGVGSLSHEYWFGYCPKGKDAELAAKCGIEDDSPLTMFGGRYIIPIITADNKVIGFVGRLPDAEVDADHPKYLNSENSSVFKKRCVFFNEKALYDSSFSEIIVVEGPFDALSFIASGVRNVVSPLGANLSDQQLSLLRRKPNRKVILGFDRDDAGKKATKLALRYAKDLRVAVLSADFKAQKDANDLLLKEGADYLSKATSSILGPDYLFMVAERLKTKDGKAYLDTDEGQEAFWDSLASVIGAREPAFAERYPINKAYNPIAFNRYWARFDELLTRHSSK